MYVLDQLFVPLKFSVSRLEERKVFEDDRLSVEPTHTGFGVAPTVTLLVFTVTIIVFVLVHPPASVPVTV